LRTWLLACALAAASPLRSYAQVAPVDSGAPGARLVTGMVVDASTGLSVAFASIRGRGVRATSDARGSFRIAAARADTLRIRRLGYRTSQIVVGTGSLTVVLVPVAARLAAVRIAESHAAPAARTTVTRDVPALRDEGASSTGRAVGSLPFVSSRGARGELALSMRGSRSEQVVVTLDGMALNDPATGRADVGDIPLAALGAIAAAPGADVVGAGSGASGGVVALTSDTAPVLALSGGSYGRIRGEAAWSARVGDGQLRIGGGVVRSTDDFDFRNSAAATGADSVERRVNNDARVTSAFMSAVLPRVQLVALASEAEQGMVGPMNVRTYDAARGRRRRLYARVGLAPRGVALSGAVRAFGLRYRDPTRPDVASDAASFSLDVAATRSAGPLSWSAGGGVDHATATGLARQQRPRAFAAVTMERARGAWRARAGARADALGGDATQPSFDAGIERVGRMSPFLRIGQAFRAPTLYDLYFASPQRIVARELSPERVNLDAEAGARLRIGSAMLVGSAFVRRTRQAIVWFPGSVGWSPQNVDRERVEGAEGSATWSVPVAELRLWGGRYRTRLFTGPLVLPTPYVPYSAGGASAVARLGASSIATSLRVDDRRPFAVAPASRTTELPGVALVDVHLAHRVVRARHSASIVVGVDNVGDVAWQSIRGYPTAGRTWSAGLTITP
jgi:outer membrane cobalamin receptor